MKKLLSLTLFTLLVQILAGQSAQRPKPNVLLILVDDLGWQDVGIYDEDEPSPYETPNIDKLARRSAFKWIPHLRYVARVAVQYERKASGTNQEYHCASGKPPMLIILRILYLPWCRWNG